MDKFSAVTLLKGEEVEYLYNGSYQSLVTTAQCFRYARARQGSLLKFYEETTGRQMQMLKVRSWLGYISLQGSWEMGSTKHIYYS